MPAGPVLPESWSGIQNHAPSMPVLFLHYPGKTDPPLFRFAKDPDKPSREPLPDIPKRPPQSGASSSPVIFFLSQFHLPDFTKAFRIFPRVSGHKAFSPHARFLLFTPSAGSAPKSLRKLLRPHTGFYSIRRISFRMRCTHSMISPRVIAPFS